MSQVARPHRLPGGRQNGTTGSSTVRVLVGGLSDSAGHGFRERPPCRKASPPSQRLLDSDARGRVPGQGGRTRHEREVSVTIVDGAAVAAGPRRVPQRHPLLVQLGRFALVGCVIATLNTAIFLVARIWWETLPANLVAVILSAAASTELNRRFTFSGAAVRGWRLHVQTGLAALYYAFSSSIVLLVLDVLTTSTTPTQESVAVAVSGVLAALGRFTLIRNWVLNTRRNAAADRAADVSTPVDDSRLRDSP
jgi:putative flippase GtrA